MGIGNMDISVFTSFFEDYGSWAIFLIVLLEYLNLPGFPAGVIMPLAGIFAAHQRISLASVMVISAAAGELGSWILYFIGRYGGSALLELYLRKFPKHKPVWDRTADLIRRRGYWGVFLGKLIPVVRTLVPIPAGMARMHFVRYSIASLLGILLWNGVLVGLGYALGERVFSLLGM